MLAHDAVDLVDRFGGSPSNVALDRMQGALIYGLFQML
jgi:mannose/fructose-specific phosphotransferase system component IIA